MALTKKQVKLIQLACDRVFDNILARVLERPPVDKRVYIGFTPKVTLPSLFAAASAEEYHKADKLLLSSLLEIVEGYLEAQRNIAKSRIVRSVDAFLREAEVKKVKTDLETVLGGEIYGIWGKTQDEVTKIIQSESNVVKNTGILDSIVKVAALNDVSDPVVYFLPVKDRDLCDECRKVHLLDDEVTPRVWKLSEVKHGYHVRGEDSPSLSGLHPLCRCTLLGLPKGYGFKAGKISFISPDHNELENQRQQ